LETQNALPLRGNGRIQVKKANGNGNQQSDRNRQSVGGDPVVRTLPNSGQNVANFSLATTERFTDRNGARQQRTEWLRVVAFGRLAETCERFLSKGRQVYVEERLTTRQYEAKGGSGKRYRTEIVAQQIRFLGKGSDAEAKATAEEIPF
jgi:single-strand DNA-binding protein